MDTLLHIIKKFIPQKFFRALQPAYHRLIALVSALWYRFPSRKLYVIGVTGTKGKSTTTELINAMLEEAGFRTALSNTIRFKIADESRPNLYKMSMPGRFFMQRFLHDALYNGCRYAIIEMTSEGAKLHRHEHIYLDALIFTNISPEHIESHGSFEKYLQAKLSLKTALEKSPKLNKFMIANRDDDHGAEFLDVQSAKPIPFSLKMAEPYALNERGTLLTLEGVSIHTALMGKFNIYNILAAATFARTLGLSVSTIKHALEKVEFIKGRVEKIEAGQKFTVIVDYAHTTDSLEKLYETFKASDKICVLGNTGGGRDKWKRPEMAAIADRYCKHIILTNEDPYDEAPLAIINDMKAGIRDHTPEIILDRREAIAHALSLARDRDVVLITGKGTDPYIMGPNNTKTSWSDAQVAREELEKLLAVK